MRKHILFIVLLFATTTFATRPVTLEQLEQDGWAAYKGQRIKLTTPLIVCGRFADSITLSTERLYVPEERAVGLAEGDSTRYWELVNYNRSHAIKLVCKTPFWLNLGSTVRNLEAYVVGERSLQTGQQPTFKNYKPSKKLPDLGKHDMLVCAANIQNYFVHLGGYASKRTTPQQQALQRFKVASALTYFDADLYAICEIEKGTAAPRDLVAAMNEIKRSEVYDFVRTSETDGDTISVGYIYRKDKIKPFGELRCAYEAPNIYAYRFMLQGFEHLASGERFVVSLNHPRSKRGTPQYSNQKRMANVEAILGNIRQAYEEKVYEDPDILMLGDYNCYRYEEPNQTIVKAGFEDMLASDSLNYSYCYKGECGSLDRVFATPTMATQITGVAHIHWNTDYYYSAAYYSKYNFNDKPYDVQQNNIKKIMTKAAKKNLLFRYSDHDPVLIGIKF